MAVGAVPTLGVILAGGAGRRFGGRDKAWLRLAGQPLLFHAHAALAAQVDALVVASSRHRWAYRRLGLDVIADQADWRGRGPLAAIATVLSVCPPSYRRIAVLPVDVPRLPVDWVSSLHQALDGGDGALAAAVFDGERRQPLLAVLDVDLAPAARDAMSGPSSPSMQAWLDRVGAIWVTVAGEDLDYRNVNHPQELDALRRHLRGKS